jgi:uncharacterized protein (TIGR02646 family)
MIRVPLGPAPPELQDPESIGPKERAAAVAFFADPANKDGEFPFKAYKHDAVKRALNETFGFKCAYCESSFGETQPIDVEHYRPKSGFAIDRKLVKPGYYWLAASWGNLLPSCIDCNRGREQVIVGGATGTAGKANQFPVRSEQRRARKPGEEAREGRLLLHPSLDRPEAHLEFIDDGIVRPSASSTGRQSAKGRASIEVYALQRDGVVRGRKARQKLIRVEIGRARKAAMRMNQPGAAAFDFAGDLRESLAMLSDFIAPGAPYAGMARQMIQPVIEELTG